MYDSVGICSICALVCHKGHSMSYAKYSSFFCDCGAENDENDRGMCTALVPRVKKDQKDKGKPTIGIRLDSNLGKGYSIAYE